jgi:xanthine dehydrogenase YagR molybdenum-binding subunit
MPIAELMARRGVTSVEGQASVKPGAEMERYSMHAFGAQFAEVRVDPELGEIRVVRYPGAFDAGHVMNPNISEYLVPVNADVPPIEIIVVPNDDRVSNPLGAKGIGELPMCGVAAVIANAVWHATGLRVRKVPVRVEDVLSA